MLKLISKIFDTFFPRICTLCGDNLLYNEKYVCNHCLSSLPRVNIHKYIDGNFIEQMFWGKFKVFRATSFLYYSKDSDTRKLLFELKYYKNKYLGEVLGRYMARELKDFGIFNDVDYIIPIPLHKNKEKSRGYNQSEWISKGISSLTGIPVKKDIVVRAYNTLTQTKKEKYERWENIDGVFSLVSEINLENKHILLVDDVLTTGATITACADSMKKVRGLRISALTFAIAKEN